MQVKRLVLAVLPGLASAVLVAFVANRLHIEMPPLLLLIIAIVMVWVTYRFLPVADYENQEGDYETQEDLSGQREYPPEYERRTWIGPGWYYRPESSATFSNYDSEPEPEVETRLPTIWQLTDFERISGLSGLVYERGIPPYRVILLQRVERWEKTRFRRYVEVFLVDKEQEALILPSARFEEFEWNHSQGARRLALRYYQRHNPDLALQLRGIWNATRWL